MNKIYNVEDLRIDPTVAPNVKQAIETVCKAVNYPMPIIGTVISHGDAPNAVATEADGEPALFVTPGLATVSQAEIEGTIAHEIGHLVRGDNENEVAMGFLRWDAPRIFKQIAYTAEFAADKFAAEHGYGPGLIGVLSKISTVPSLDHPGTAERIEKIREVMKKG